MTNILIIEDEADIAESLAYNLRREGFQVTVADSGEIGLRIALDRDRAFDLIVLDVMLPGMNGLEICRRLRREPQTECIPIVMLSAKASKTDEKAGIDMGADVYIKKPFSIKELRAVIVNQLVKREKDAAFAAGSAAR